jgi:hypothetical protein
VGSLDRRLRALEDRNPQEPPTSRMLEEIRAIDAEIARLESEMRAEGIDPEERLQDVDVSIPLDEHIAMLEAEIAREEA